MKLTEDEKQLLDSVEQGQWESVANLPEEARRYQEYAKATFRKDKRVNIRISQRDLVKLQQRAVAEGLPYQTFISSVLHKFVGGHLVEKPS